ncbi:MAG TPA: class I SAM-dependent methyltransferase [Gemmatimonadaceae bacterium]|nr:class I SAM-dependent methyltransferase [Gemmatimonadaceae bacterium]
MKKSYDRAYFDRWYRDERTRVVERQDVERKALLAVAAAEYFLGRPVASVLDVGCGEGAWQPALAKLRPRATYLGVDPSEYAVKRYGRRRNIRLGSFGALDEAGIEGPYDLVISVGVVNYLAPKELASGLQTIAAVANGVAFIEAFASGDEIEGDTVEWKWRKPSWWRDQFREAGLTPVGMHCYVAAGTRETTVALERAE